MQKKLGFRDFHKIIKDARGEADRPVNIAIAGERPDAENLKAFFGTGAERVFSVIDPDDKSWPRKDIDLVIVTFGGAAPIAPIFKQAVEECRAYALETLVLIDEVRLSETTLAAKKVEAEIAFDLSPGRIRSFSIAGETGDNTTLLRYILDRVRDKEIPLAAQLPIMRPMVVNDIIDSVANENGLVGLINFLPGTDLPLLTANQMRMVLKIAAAYGVALSLSRARELLFVLGGGFTFRAVARQAAGLVPVAGWAVKGAIAYSGTRTVGLLAKRYFEGLQE